MVFRTAAFVFAAPAMLGSFVFKRLPPLRGKTLTCKMLCSGSFVLTGVCTALATGFTSYGDFLLGGLMFGALGDFFLDYQGGKHFNTGAVFFGMGHIFYIIGFLFCCEPNIMLVPAAYFRQTAVAALAIVVISAAVILLNKISFRGKMPVAVYSLVLIASFLAAFTRGMIALTMGDTGFGICLVAASALFIVSDICVAIHVLGKVSLKFFHRMTGAMINPTYFPAQALFALSILFVG